MSYILHISYFVESAAALKNSFILLLQLAYNSLCWIFYTIIVNPYIFFLGGGVLVDER